MVSGAARFANSSAWYDPDRIHPSLRPDLRQNRLTSGRSSLSETMEHRIEHEDKDTKGAFFIQQNGARVAEMAYSRTNATLIIIDHTEVDESLTGQGVGRQLLGALVAWARSNGTKVIPLCPFAKAQFGKDPAIRDVLV